MAIKIKGKTYWYVDTQVIDEVIYDIYQDDKGNVFYKAIDTIF